MSKRNPLPAPQEGAFNAPYVTVRINKTWVTRMLELLDPMGYPSFWEGDETTQLEATDQAQEIITALMTGNYSMIGSIVMWPSDYGLPEHMLWCDGGLYNRVDYPDLYFVSGGFIEDDNTFRTPDFNGRFPLGADGARETSDTGGAETVTLDTTQMPAHTHAAIPHSHSIAPHGHQFDTSTTLANAGNLGPNMGAHGTTKVSAVATNSVGLSTNSVSASVQNTGGGLAHNNMPPWLAVKFAVVAK